MSEFKPKPLSLFRALDNLFSYVLTVISRFIWRREQCFVSDPSAMKLNIKFGPSCSYLVDVKKQDDVAQLKQSLVKQLQTKNLNGKIKIIFAGKELLDNDKIEDFDIGQYSVLHAIQLINEETNNASHQSSRSITEGLFSGAEENFNAHDKKMCFYVYCSKCKGITPGKIRINCANCNLGTLIVDQDPKCWDDVLEPGCIAGKCQTDDCDGTVAEFYFKCASNSHKTDEKVCDKAVALHLIRSNLYDVSCMICTDTCPVILVFPCPSTHVICLQCFQEYCKIKITERQFVQDRNFGYTLPCPAGCENSLIKETHHFRVLEEMLYERYQRFGAEECLLQAGGVICPQPNCGAGILPDETCRKVTCVQEGSVGCGFVFCRTCLQGYHIGECSNVLLEASGYDENGSTMRTSNGDGAKWNEASQLTIRMTTKPCPQCRTPTERNEGCMHIICARPNCGFHWCWLCQTDWSRDCMARHWFG